VIAVTPRARRHDDRAGDPLDGLVNMFDIGIVLAVGFLLAALSSLNLTTALTKTGLARPPSNQVTVTKDQTVAPVPTAAPRVIGRGTQVGTVYRLSDGRLVYVVGSSPATPTPSPATSGPSTASPAPSITGTAP
jgi:hypothetical protein